MPSRQPVLALAVDNISKIDTVDCERLSSLWTVFTKCAEDLENGRRLENLSWRLWYRECRLLDQERPNKRNVLANHDSCRLDMLEPQSELPPLSRSVDSAHSELETNLRDHTGTIEMSGQKHLTPGRFHQLVAQVGQHDLQDQFQEQFKRQDVGPIQHVAAGPSKDKRSTFSKDRTLETVDIAARTPSYVKRPTQVEKSEAINALKSEGISSVVRRASSVVHGFNPSPASLSQMGSSPSIAHARMPVSTAPSTSMFFIESSPSCSDSEQQLLSLRHRRKKQDSPKTSQSVRAPPTKHMSYRQILDEASGYHSSPFDSDDEDNAKKDSHIYGESAIVSDDDEEVSPADQVRPHARRQIHDLATQGDERQVSDDRLSDRDLTSEDADDDDWDSVCSESRANSVQESNMFHKMENKDDKPVLASRRSILSTLLTNPMTRLTNAQSKSSPAISQSRKPSPSASPAVPHATANGSQLPGPSEDRSLPADIKGSLSPRTTRRNMLATELSESLRRHLLWERRQKSTGNLSAAPTALQRRHTAFDLTKLSSYPRPSSSFDASQRADHDTDNEFGYNGAGW